MAHQVVSRVEGISGRISRAKRNRELEVNCGEVLEWPIRRAWRARVAFGYRGFESHPLRHPFFYLFPPAALASSKAYPLMDTTHLPRII